MPTSGFNKTRKTSGFGHSFSYLMVALVIVIITWLAAASGTCLIANQSLRRSVNVDGASLRKSPRFGVGTFRARLPRGGKQSATPSASCG